MSFIELFPKNWQQHNYLSLGGVSGKALRQFLSERPDVERVFLCLDADKAGENACKRLAALLPDTVSVTRIQPCMKDWNDVLVHRAEIPNRNYFKSMQKIKRREVDSNCQCLPAIILQINIVRIMVYISFPIGKWRKRPATDPVLSR